MNKKGFTLVELLAVVAILAVLVLIALPNVMELFNEAKKDSFENEVRNIYSIAKSQAVIDSYELSNASEIKYSSRLVYGQNLKVQGRSDLKYCVVADSSGNIEKLYVSDGKYMFVSDDIEKIDDIHAEEFGDGELSDIENCISPPTDSSLLSYSVSGDEVTITGLKDGVQIVDSQKCIDYLTENAPFSNCAWNQTDYCTATDLDYEYCGPAVKYVLLSKIPEEDYEKAGLKVKSINRLIIPSEIDGKPVTGISKYAFIFNKIKTVSFPNSLTSIGNYAFAYNKISSLTIPSGISKISINSFASNNLTSITIPSNISVIEGNAFIYNQIKSVNISNGVTSINNSAFGYNQITSLTLPNSVTKIEANAFCNNQLKFVKLSENVTTIGMHAFRKNQIKIITIPRSVTSLSSYAFDENKLESVIIEGKTSSGAFSTYGNYLWGWDDNVSCVKNNITNVENGCITWLTDR